MLTLTKDPELIKKLDDIKNHPELHRHSFDSLTSCCMHNGALDILLMSAHEEYCNIGTNGGAKCDVVRGPCSCGAWHG